MKVFKKKNKNFIYLMYRVLSPVIDPIRLYTGLIGYVWFFRDLILYKLQNHNAKLLTTNIYPILDEKVSFTPFDAHYYYQQLWVFEHILKNKPKEHVDVASTYQLSGYLSKIVKTTFIDLRPIKTRLKNLSVKRGTMLDMPYENSSVESLSCLHSIEHVGLGRYGDPIDPQGTKKACREFVRILAKGGKLYISTPVGKEKICFNAHRIHRPQTIKNYFNKLQLISFSGVDDNGTYYEKANFKDFANMDYACGMFIFKK